MENRKRIWSLAKGINELLELHPPYDNDDFSGGDYIWEDRIEDVPEYGGLGPSARRWVVEPDIKEKEVPNERFTEGCRMLHEQYFTLPEDFVSIAFSVVANGYTEYLVGMRFISKDGGSKQLGYMNTREELHYKVTAIQGFIVAIGSRGIHGLQVLGTDGCISDWFGSPKDSPVTKRLIGTQSITELEAGLDVRPNGLEKLA